MELDRTKVTKEMLANVMMKMDMETGMLNNNARAKSKAVKDRYMKEAATWIKLPTDEWEDWMVKGINDQMGLFNK